jgi:hypothetical protein
MTNLMRAVWLGGLLLCAAAAPAAAQGRGDHDTPATQRKSEGDERLYVGRFCRTDDDGWVRCRDRDGRWRRARADPNFGDWWEDLWDDLDDDPPRRRRMIDGDIVARQLYRRGFEDLRDMKLRGNVYSAKAIDRRGRPVIVTVDPYSGEIIDVVRR